MSKKPGFYHFYDKLLGEGGDDFVLAVSRTAGYKFWAAAQPGVGF
jgi:hypothetical protein